MCVALVCPAKRRSHGTPVNRLPLRTDTTRTVCSAKAGHKKMTEDNENREDRDETREARDDRVNSKDGADRKEKKDRKNREDSIIYII